MKNLLLSAALVATSGFVGATTANAATVYAQSVVSVTPGARPATPRPLDATGIANGDADRYTTSNILGAPDTDFYSLGHRGSIVLDFGNLVRTPGKVIEVTFSRREQGDNGFEFFDIFVGLTAAVQSTFLGSFDNGFGDEDGRTLSYTLTADVGDFRYVRIVDKTPGNGRATDGADIESIGFAPVPVPAAGLLLGGALFGLGALRRRAKKTA